MPTVSKHLPFALRNHDVRHACAAVDAILLAADTLDTLPPVALEQIRDFCADYTKGRKNVRSRKRASFRCSIMYAGLTGESA